MCISVHIEHMERSNTSGISANEPSARSFFRISKLVAYLSAAIVMSNTSGISANEPSARSFFRISKLVAYLSAAIVM